MPVPDMRERGGDAVQERLGANEAVIGEHVGALGEVLARAEANLEVQWTVVAEQAPRRNLAFRRYCNLREQLIHELLLALAQFVPARPAVKPVEGQRIARFERGHLNVAPRAAGTGPQPEREPLVRCDV